MELPSFSDLERGRPVLPGLPGSVSTLIPFPSPGPESQANGVPVGFGPLAGHSANKHSLQPRLSKTHKETVC